MIKKSSLPALITLGCAAILVASEPLRYGDNVCNVTEIIEREKLVKVPVEYDIQYQTICGILPCTKTKPEIRMTSKVETVYHKVEKLVCCPGYVETSDRKCEPICMKSCISGKCVSPGVCKCSVEPTNASPGFVGPTCGRFVCLAENRWGPDCDKECDCPATAYCSASDGKCLCMPGWRGANCSEACDSSSPCDDLVFPRILDPEVNVIHDNPSSEKLLPLNDKLDENEDSSRSAADIIATHMTINLFCFLITASVLFMLFWYKKRFNQLRNNLYYGPCSTISRSSRPSEDSESHIYSSPSINSSLQSRPRMPAPHESDYLSKNISFDGATRNVFTNHKDSNPEREAQNFRNLSILDPRVESHLIESQRSCEQNIYSDLEINLSGNEKTKNTVLKLNLIPEESEYQVPRLATPRASGVDVSLSLSVKRPDSTPIQLNSSLDETRYEAIDEPEAEEESYYQELKPKP